MHAVLHCILQGIGLTVTWVALQPTCAATMHLRELPHIVLTPLRLRETQCVTPAQLLCTLQWPGAKYTCAGYTPSIMPAAENLLCVGYTTDLFQGSRIPANAESVPRVPNRTWLILLPKAIRYKPLISEYVEKLHTNVTALKNAAHQLSLAETAASLSLACFASINRLEEERHFITIHQNPHVSAHNRTYDASCDSKSGPTGLQVDALRTCILPDLCMCTLSHVIHDVEAARHKWCMELY